MPMCYGGGIKNIEQAKRILSLGVEKLALSSSIINNLDIIDIISAEIGAQSVCAVLDVKKSRLLGKYYIYTINGKKKSGKELFSFVKELAKRNIGEIIINSIDRDGEMCGYDINMLDKVRELVNFPLTILGGAGSIDHIINLVNRHRIIGAAAGSLFVFKGALNAVLINYPNNDIKNQIFQDLK